MNTGLLEGPEVVRPCARIGQCAIFRILSSVKKLTYGLVVSRPTSYLLHSRRSVMGFLLVLGCLLASPSVLNAWTPTSTQATVSVFGGASSDVGQAVVVDASGNTFTTGYFTGTVDFDPGAGTTNLTSAGAQDVFLSKLDASGNLVWARNFGGTSNEAGQSVALDSTGNIHVGGYFTGTVDFDPGVGATSLTSAGLEDAYIAKFDSSGALLWVRGAGGTSNERVRSVAVDASNNVFGTGGFQGTVDFDPGVSVSNLVSAGSIDVFMWKLDSSGGLAWVRQAGSTNIDEALSLAIGASGSVYSTGRFMGTVDFDPSASASNLTAGVQDVFVWKLDASGGFGWGLKLGGASAELANSLSVDAAENVYISGSFQGTADFDPGAGIVNLTSAGGTDVFIAKLDSSGGYVWARHIGSASSDSANSVTVDSAGNVYLAGVFGGTVDFDPGAGIVNLTSAGGTDAFVSKLDSSGGFVWARQLGASLADQALSVVVDSVGNTYTTGSFQDTTDFETDAGITNLTSAGGTDVFVLKLDVLGLSTVPTIASSSSSSTSSLAPTTTVASTSTVVANVSVTATTTTTTTPAERSSQVTSSGLPSTGSSMSSFVMWSGAMLAAGVLLQLRVRRLTQ